MNATTLRAGPLALRFDAGDLRYLKLGEREVIRRIYSAVRDRNWGTVPGVISDLETQISDQDFRIRYTCTHRQNEIHFVWQAEIVGAADGSIQFTFDGEAKSTFFRNRIGFCVLHPIRECAGSKCRALYADGSAKELLFPDTIAVEQPVNGLHDLVGLEHQIEPGVWAALEFEGDLFETEDQRNWIDASFKTFCTPLRVPYPVEINAGTRLKQMVKLRLAGIENSKSGAITSSTAGVTDSQIQLRSPSAPPITIRRGSESCRLPALGLGAASHSCGAHEQQVIRLRKLKPAHLRVDVRLWDDDWRERFLRADGDAADLNAPIELALHVNESAESGLKDLGEFLRETPRSLCRLMVFQRGQKSTTSAALHAVRRYLGAALEGVPIGTGTNADLFQLNLQRPPSEADFICWSMNPQVHAFDNASIAETPEAAAQQVVSVRRYFPGKPLVVSPITLKPRFNPVATGSEPIVPPGELPPQVDPRQLSLFGAAWTLAMLQALAQSGADSVTFYETTGWRGVMETPAGSALPEKFPSIAGAVFPLYHVLADIGEFAGGEALRAESSDPLNVAALWLRAGPRRRLMLANLSAEPRRVTLQGFDQIIRVRVMDASNKIAAMTSPEQFRAGSSPFHGTALDLEAHALATLDFAAGDYELRAVEATERERSFVPRRNP